MATCLRNPEHTESGGYAGESHRGGGLLCPSRVSHLPLESFVQPSLAWVQALPCPNRRPRDQAVAPTSSRELGSQEATVLMSSGPSKTHFLYL